MTAETAREVLHRLADEELARTQSKIQEQMMVHGSCLVRYWFDGVLMHMDVVDQKQAVEASE